MEEGCHHFRQPFGEPMLLDRDLMTLAVIWRPSLTLWEENPDWAAFNTLKSIKSLNISCGSDKRCSVWKYSTGIRLMENLHIHSMIFFWGCVCRHQRDASTIFFSSTGMHCNNPDHAHSCTQVFHHVLMDKHVIDCTVEWADGVKGQIIQGWINHIWVRKMIASQNLPNFVWKLLLEELFPCVSTLLYRDHSRFLPKELMCLLRHRT